MFKSALLFLSRARNFGKVGPRARTPLGYAPEPAASRYTAGAAYNRRGASAFTLIELMVVMTLILILASMAVPTYHVAVVRAREAVLREDLYTMRKLIDQYTIDKQQAPQTLQDLVDTGYLRGGIPVDPFTMRNDTWQTDTEDVPLSEQAGPGIVNVHSGAEQNSLDGTPYNTW